MSTLNQLSAALAGRYRIERELGVGGMATVYLAEDVRHRRRVALKALHPELSAVIGSERFLKEIELTASLQHPHILPLFDSGEADGQLYYVMPLVDGETLRGRLEREHQLPVNEAVRLAMEVADALQYAHERGIVHRDIKPENILLQGGHALVADFGIALAVQQAGGQRMTQTGLSLGTPQYMSPEQAMGDKTIDARTDVYALGAVVYEMLVGEPPFTGPTSQAVVARVLTEKPRGIRASRPAVPEQIEATVERALEKLAADRWSTVRELSEALAGTRQVVRASTSVTAAMPASVASSRRLTLREGAAWALAALALAYGGWKFTGREAPAPLMRLGVELADSIVASGSTNAALPSVAISRDGLTLAYIGSRDIIDRGMRSQRSVAVRRISDAGWRTMQLPLSGSSPTFSPDGNSLAYHDEMRQLRRISVNGGTSPVLFDSVASVSWGDDGIIYAVRSNGIWAVDPNSERRRRVVSLDNSPDSLVVAQISVLPGSRLAVARLRADGAFTIGLLDLTNGDIRDLRVDGHSPRYVEPGYLVFQTEDGVLSAAPFSARKREITGAAIRIADGVELLGNGGLDYDAAPNGTIIYRWTSRPDRLEPTQLVVVDNRGKTQVIRQDGKRYDQPRSSPDGRHVLVRIGGTRFNTGDLWVLELASGALTRLTNDNSSYRAVWSRDGKRIYWLTGNPIETVLRSKPWDGSGSDSVVLRRPGIAEFAEGPAGGWSALRTYGQRDILLVPTDSIGTATPRPFVVTPNNETDIALSPSGALLAYQSDETGRYEIYVRAVPGPGPRVPVSIGGGTQAIWSRDGSQLYFRSDNRIIAAHIVEKPVLGVTRRESLFEASLVTDGLNLTVLPDAKGFMGAIGPDPRAASQFRIGMISNWQSLMARKE